MIKEYWGKFEAWVHSWFPGFKTRIVNFLGIAGSTAAVVQGYVTGLPTTKYISTEALALVSAGLFTLSYWFHGMGERVEARKEAE